MINLSVLTGRRQIILLILHMKQRPPPHDHPQLPEKGQALYNHEIITDLSGILRISLKMFVKISQHKQIRINSDIEQNICVRVDPYAAGHWYKTGSLITQLQNACRSPQHPCLAV